MDCGADIVDEILCPGNVMRNEGKKFWAAAAYEMV